MTTINSAVGAVMISKDHQTLKTWILSALEDYEIESHGKQYSQKFLALKSEQGFSVCFYVITGYATEAEDRAFEHAEFVMDGFIEELDDTRPKAKCLAFVDVGNEIETNELIGFKTLDAGMRHFKTDLESIAALRKIARSKGEVLWEVPR